MKKLCVTTIPVLAGFMYTLLLLPVQAADFARLIKESALVFQLPRTFTEIEIDPQVSFPYEKAIYSAQYQVEVRYALRPLKRIRVDYEDPHGAAPQPNHLFSMMFTALLGELSRGGDTPYREFPQQQAKSLFHADWAALALLDVDPEFSSRYPYCFLLAIHKNNVADAYLFILFQDYNNIKPLLPKLYASIRFQ